MNFLISKNFESLKAALLDSIANFNSYEAGFGTGNRNSVKKVDLEANNFVVKSFKIPNTINQIVYRYFRKSKAKRSYEYANKLIAMGFKTPTPVAYLEHFNSIGLQKSFYISQYLNYDFTFREIDISLHKDHATILSAFTKFTFDLHENGIQFLDHSPGNTLIVKNNNSYDFYLVDLNRMVFGPMNFEQKMKNFSRLTPRKEMVEFMSDAYAELIMKSKKEVFAAMWHQVQIFKNKTARKTRLKKRFLGK